MIRILALVPKLLGISPGQRYRLEQWAPHLASRHGITLDFLPGESRRTTELLANGGHIAEKACWLMLDTVRRAGALSRARAYDGVLVYREIASLGPAVYERLLDRLGCPMIFDFDDAIWLPSPGSLNGAFARLRFPGKTATICALASAVVVGNRYLAEWAGHHNPRVFVVPTSIELDRYPLQPTPPDGPGDPFIVVWTGSHSTVPYLEVVRDALDALAQRIAPRRLVLRVICDRPPLQPFHGFEVDFVRWRDATEAEDVGRAHVGIMPLPDDQFTRGKCALKALQYMGVGRPVVLSPVGVNRDVVRSGENGFLATTTEEWVTALARLAAEPELARRMGAAGRRTVEQGYTAEISARGFAAAVRSAVGAPRAQTREAG